jgi:hypothetical protein
MMQKLNVVGGEFLTKIVYLPRISALSRLD